MTSFLSIIGKHAGWSLSISLYPEVASGQSGDDHFCLDAFYIKPNMHHFLRAAMFDSGSLLNGQVGPQGIIRFNSELQRA